MYVERCTVEPANHISYVLGMGHAGWAGEEVVIPAIVRFLRSHMRPAAADTEEDADTRSGDEEGAVPQTLSAGGAAGSAPPVPVALAQRPTHGGEKDAPTCVPVSATCASTAAESLSQPGPPAASTRGAEMDGGLSASEVASAAAAAGTAAVSAAAARPPLPRNRSASGVRAAAPHTGPGGSPDGVSGGGTPNPLARRGSAPPAGCGSPPLPASGRTSVRRGSASSATSGTPPTPPPPAINAALANPHARMGTLAGLDLGQVLAVLAAEEEARRTMPA